MDREQLRELWRRATAKYALTPKGQANRERYIASGKRRAVDKKYDQSEKGKIRRARSEADPMRKIGQCLNQQAPHIRLAAAIHKQEKRRREGM